VESSSRPFVAVIGGLWQLKPERVAAAKAAAKVIGEELAKAGFGLLVYFSNEESLEPHVVSGYISALGSGAGAIRVRYAESQRGQVRFAEEATRQELFEHLLFPGQDWEAPFYRSLAEDKGVEAVLLLGGAKSTLIAGLIAVARRLPILAVDEFGGSAGKIWNQLAHASPGNLQSWGTRPAAEFYCKIERPVRRLGCAALGIDQSRREAAQHRFANSQDCLCYGRIHIASGYDFFWNGVYAQRLHLSLYYVCGPRCRRCNRSSCSRGARNIERYRSKNVVVLGCRCWLCRRTCLSDPSVGRSAGSP
jgi:hypothetical protein